ncbi:MerR family DNA-binding transcriptional regulator [Tsukamurella pseudospumae]|uniref:MerR family DNA-binding transcriptional regulator n=1 Tax=Tsukamurella pseudospumae TaxID=239498 RepID=UPI0009ED2A04|nr:MerR family DNA-binding transcriptional regulator [Tsukamurella pseudospumae]
MRRSLNIPASVKVKTEGVEVKIGEFARLTGITERSLRHYEEAGLLVPDRSANGYRDYAVELAERAGDIRDLVSAGVPVRLVADIIDAASDAGGISAAHLDPDAKRAVEDEWERMCRCVECIAVRRDALRRYLDGAAADG